VREREGEGGRGTWREKELAREGVGGVKGEEGGGYITHTHTHTHTHTNPQI
jgi:hypothetical protein